MTRNGHWTCRSRSSTGRIRACARSWSRSGPRSCATVATSRSIWPKSPYPGTCLRKSCGGSMNCDEDPLRRRPRESTARRNRHERCVWMARKMNGLPSASRLPKSSHRMAAKGIQFPWRRDGGTVSTNLDGTWGMSDQYTGKDTGRRAIAARLHPLLRSSRTVPQTGPSVTIASSDPSVLFKTALSDLPWRRQVSEGMPG